MTVWPVGYTPPARLLAVDPGRFTLGWALFTRGAFERGGVLTVKPQLDRYPAQYRQDHTAAHAVGTEAQAQLVSDLRREVGLSPDQVVVESMRVYAGRADSQPADLINVSLTTGMVFAAFSLARPRVVAAATWKGQMGDKPTWAMIRRALGDDEIRLARACGIYDDEITKQFHHGLEAIGIALWSLWRI